TVNASINGNTLTKIGTGDLTLGGSAANSASLIVAQGKVILNKTTADVNSAATLTVGDDFGGDNADVAQVSGSATVRQAVTNLTRTSSGLLDINGKTLIVNATTTLGIGATYSADVQTGAGTLTQTGAITLALAVPANNANATMAAPPATISGTINLNNANRTVTLVNHT